MPPLASLIALVRLAAERLSATRLKMQKWQLAILALVAVALIAAIYVALRGYAVISFREKPERLIGKRVRLEEFEAYGPKFPERAFGIVRRYVEPRYLVEFEPPVPVDERPEGHAWIEARHKGWPVSSARRRRILAVTGVFESGTDFIALVEKT